MSPNPIGLFQFHSFFVIDPWYKPTLSTFRQPRLDVLLFKTGEPQTSGGPSYKPKLSSQRPFPSIVSPWRARYPPHPTQRTHVVSGVLFWHVIPPLAPKQLTQGVQITNQNRSSQQPFPYVGFPLTISSTSYSVEHEFREYYSSNK